MSSPSLLRYYSTRQAALKLWVKHNGNPSIKVPINGCIDIADFAENVKQKLNTNCQVAIFSSLDKEALRPGLAISELFKTDYLKKNSDEYPLFVKLIPVTPEPIVSKTIYIRDMLDSFRKRVVQSDADMEQIYERKGSGLYLLSEPLSIVTDFRQLKDGEKYNVFSRYEQSFSEELRWQQMEDKAMEEEIALAMKNYLQLHLGSNVIEMPTVVYGRGGNVVQEWDAAYKVDDVLYLCRAKYVMCVDKIPKLFQHISLFKEQFQLHAQKEFMMGINKVVGVACADYIPPLVRNKAHELGLMCVYPSGWRYNVDKKLPNGFKIEF